MVSVTNPTRSIRSAGRSQSGYLWNRGQRGWGPLFCTLLFMAIVVLCALYGAYLFAKAWLKKHKRTLLITAGVIGGGVALYHGLQSLGLIYQPQRADNSAQTTVSQEVEDCAEAHSRSGRASLSTENIALNDDATYAFRKGVSRELVPLDINKSGIRILQNHFESIQRISETTTLPSVLPQLKASLFAQVDLSGLTEKLMLGKQDPEALSSRDKMQLWQELKTLSFTRTVCAMWGISLLDVFIHIQLNILGRHVYLDTAKNMSKSKEVHVPLSLSCQKKFIAFAGYLPHKGLQLLITDTHEAVDIVLKGKDLKEPCTLDDLRDVFMKIRAMIDSRQEGWAQYVLPAENALPDGLATASSAVDIAADAPPANDLFDDREELAQLMIETRAVLASNEFQEVLAVCLDAILDGVMEEVHSVYRGAPNHGIPLAKLLPPIAGSGITLLNHPDENRFLQILATLPQVQSFCALVYTTTSEEAKV